MIISKKSKINLLFKAYGYWIFKRKLARTQYKTEAEFKIFQYNEIKKTLLEAQNVPYYKALFEQIGFNTEKDFNRQLCKPRWHERHGRKSVADADSGPDRAECDHPHSRRTSGQRHLRACQQRL